VLWSRSTLRASKILGRVASSGSNASRAAITRWYRRADCSWGYGCLRPRRTSVMLARNRKFADLYGAFLVKGPLPGGWAVDPLFVWALLAVLCSERERPFFVPSPAIRFAERAEGVKGPKR
jgi:hypothetical protein